MEKNVTAYLEDFLECKTPLTPPGISCQKFSSFFMFVCGLCQLLKDCPETSASSLKKHNQRTVTSRVRSLLSWIFSGAKFDQM